MSKTADFNMAQAGDSIKGWFGGLDPHVKSMLMRGLAGAAVGAGAAGGIAAATPRDRERKRSIMGPALMGALMGGTGAVALPEGLRMLGGIKFPGEEKQPLGSRVVDKAMGSTIGQHPLMAAGGVGGAWFARDSVRGLRHAMTNSAGLADAPGAITHTGAPVLKRLSEALVGPNADKFWKAPKDMYMRAVPRGKTGIRTNRAMLAMIPAAIAGGYIGDKYLKGEW